MSSPDVTQLQKFLASQSASQWPSGQSATGFFGPVTKSALVNYQSSVGISPASGYFGPITRKHVNSLSGFDSGSSGMPEVGSAATPPGQGKIAITSPIATSEWLAGQTYKVTWTSSDLPTTIRDQLAISLSNDSGAYLRIAAPTPDDGSENWTIPANLPTGTYQVTVGCLTGEVKEKSGNSTSCPLGLSQFFKVKNSNVAPVSMVSISPKTGDTLVKGQTYEVRWSFNNVPTFPKSVNKITGQEESYEPVIQNIYLTTPNNEELGYTGGMGSIFREREMGRNGLYSWTIRNDQFQSAGRFQLKIECPPELKIYGCKDAISGLFNITDPDSSKPSIDVLSARQAGEVWQPGQTYSVSWTSQNIPTDKPVQIHLTDPFRGGIFSGYASDNSGSGTVTVPLTAKPGQYQLLIRIDLNGRLIDARADYTINVPPVSSNTNLPLQPLKITSPRGGDSWALGSWQSVNWNRPLEEIDETRHGACAAYVAVVKAETKEVMGFIDYLSTSQIITGHAWHPAGRVYSPLCGSNVTEVNLPAGQYFIRLSSIDPNTEQRFNIDGEIFNLN
ncbi:MAG: peptidoglycan-binding protein [Patescibacteria group bacterium]